MRGFILALSVFALALLLLSCAKHQEGDTHASGDSAAVAQDIYTCPMHPSVISDRPGACPVCGMALVKKTAEKTSTDAELALLKGVSLSPAQRIIANVSTVPVRRGSIHRNITAVGVVDYAEPLRATVAARFRGRIEKLHVDFTGAVVGKGDPLFDLYSPDLVSATRELLLAVQAVERPDDAGEESRRRLLQATRDRLRTHFGMSDAQIARIEESRQAPSTLTFPSPMQGTVIGKSVLEGQYVDEGMVLYELADLSRVWIYLDVYEKDVPFVTVGRTVTMTTEAYPGESFSGTVTFIEPVLSAGTRTVRVRTAFPNPHGKLKPQMYVGAVIAVPAANALIIPATAVLSTGRRDVVWVEVDSATFEPRDVTLGIRTDDQVEVLKGLTEGELVVVSGGYLLESESQLQHPTGGSGGGTAGTHDHSAAARTAGEEIRIVVNGRFVPDVVHATQGRPLTIVFLPEQELGCATEVVFPALGIRRSFTPLKPTTVTFTPAATGEIRFACGMDMVTGKVVVHN